MYWKRREQELPRKPSLTLGTIGILSIGVAEAALSLIGLIILAVCLVGIAVCNDIKSRRDNTPP
jgi:hypothetical protein